MQLRNTANTLLILTLGTGAFISWSQGQTTQKPTSSKIERPNIVQLLKSQVPTSPTNPSPDTVTLMEKVGATKRVDAAVILIEALAFNFDPDNSNEILSQAQSIPAIGILKRHYGAAVLPSLYATGIQTDKVWLRERCALAVREIAPSKQRLAFAETFSLSTTQNAKAKAFKTLLYAKELNVSMYSSLPANIKVTP